MIVFLLVFSTFPEPVIVHPGAVVAILRLLPAVLSGLSSSLKSINEAAQDSTPESVRSREIKAKQYLLDLQSHIAELLRSLLRSERNQQCMCDAGESFPLHTKLQFNLFVKYGNHGYETMLTISLFLTFPVAGFASDLLSCCSKALEDESHPLHPPVQSMFERLAAQALEPRDLRAFLRLGNPLCCSALDLHFDAQKDDVGSAKKAIEDGSGTSNDASPVTAGKIVIFLFFFVCLFLSFFLSFFFFFLSHLFFSYFSAYIPFYLSFCYHFLLIPPLYSRISSASFRLPSFFRWFSCDAVPRKVFSFHDDATRSTSPRRRHHARLR